MGRPDPPSRPRNRHTGPKFTSNYSKNTYQLPRATARTTSARHRRGGTRKYCRCKNMTTCIASDHVCREALDLQHNVVCRRPPPVPGRAPKALTVSDIAQVSNRYWQDCSRRGPRDGTRISRAASHRSRRAAGTPLAYWLSCSPAAQ